LHLGDEALKGIDELLVDGGWRKGGSDGPGYVKSGPGDIRYQVSLNATVRAGTVSFHPSLGVRSNGVGDLYEVFLGRRALGDSYGVCSVGLSLYGFLEKKSPGPISHERWLIGSREDCLEKLKVLGSDIESTGEFFSGFENLEDMLIFLEGADRGVHELRHLAIIQALCGRVGDAISTMRDVLVMTESQPPFVASQGRIFFESFIDYFSIDSDIFKDY
jgi:hypothetical protein